MGPLINNLLEVSRGLRALAEESVEKLYLARDSFAELKRVEPQVDEYFALGFAPEKGMVIFDVGANVGAFSHRVAQKTDSDVTLYCFEPIPTIYRKLAANFEQFPALAATRHHLFEVGLNAEDPGTRTFHYFRNFPTDSTGDLPGKRQDFEAYFDAQGGKASTWISGDNNRGLRNKLASFSARQISAFPKGRFGRWVSDRVTGRRQFECRTTNLAEIIRQQDIATIDWMKIDVEGAELEVLKGLGATGWRALQNLTVEIHDQGGRLAELTALLHSNGMVVVKQTRPKGAADRGLPTHLLWARREA